MATLEDALGIYSAQNIIIPILEEHVMNEIMRLDILLSGTTPAPWNKNIILTTSVRDTSSWNDEVVILNSELTQDMKRAKEMVSDSLRGICYVLRLMFDRSTE